MTIAGLSITPVAASAKRLLGPVQALLVSLFVLTMTGCMSDEGYVRTGFVIPDGWRTDISEGTGDADAVWWNAFDDPVLDTLISRALRDNRDVRVAAARVEANLGRVGLAGSARFPQIGLAASRARARSSQRTGPQVLSSFTEPEFNQFQTQVNVNWELDFFGRLRTAHAAARYDLLASAHARRAVVMSLVSAVAGRYVELRNLDRQLEITRATLTARKEAQRVFTARYRRGAISELEWNQSRAEVESVSAGIPALERAVAQQENALSLLLGHPPGDIPRGKSITELVVPSVPAGLPSSLLSRRPDLLQAESELQAAQLRVSEARLAFLPTLSLTGAFGYASKALKGLLADPSMVWSMGAELAAPLFRGGALRGQLAQARASREETALRYAGTVENAFRETDDALVAVSTLREQLAATRRAIEALARAATLARLRYENGSTAYLDVLDAERNLFSARLDESQLEANLLGAHIDLYRAMGGGWIIVADHEAMGIGTN